MLPHMPSGKLRRAVSSPTQEGWTKLAAQPQLFQDSDNCRSQPCSSGQALRTAWLCYICYMLQAEDVPALDAGGVACQGQQHVWGLLHAEQQQAHCSFIALKALAMVAANTNVNVGKPLQSAGLQYLLPLARYGHHRFQADFNPKLAQLHRPRLNETDNAACQGLGEIQADPHRATELASHHPCILRINRTGHADCQGLALHIKPQHAHTEQQSLLQPTCAFTNLMTLAMLTARGRHSTRNWMLAFSWASRSLDRVLPEGNLLSCTDSNAQ